MQYYSQYRLEDFYKKHYWQGGVSLGQVKILYEQAVLREIEERRFQASIHGIDLSKENKQQNTSTAIEAPKNQSLPIFQDPKEYNHLSTEEKEELTNKMMGHHRKWAEKAL